MEKTDYAIDRIVFYISFILWVVLYGIGLLSFEMCLFLVLLAGFSFIGMILYDSNKKKK